MAPGGDVTPRWFQSWFYNCDSGCPSLLGGCSPFSTWEEEREPDGLQAPLRAPGSTGKGWRFQRTPPSAFSMLPKEGTARICLTHLLPPRASLVPRCSSSSRAQPLHPQPPPCPPLSVALMTTGFQIPILLPGETELQNVSVRGCSRDQVYNTPPPPPQYMMTTDMGA